MNKLLEISTHFAISHFNSMVAKDELFFEEITLENMKFIPIINGRCNCSEFSSGVCIICAYSYRYLNNELWIFDYDNKSGVPV